jgi:patatin-like phospholipase/acyl hydrolase
MNQEISKSFRILSIDGGGIKGLYSAIVLSVLEKKFNFKSSEHFDLICGTSTGGIIALGLAAGKSAEEIKEFYLKHGNEIFPSKNWFQRTSKFMKSIFFKSKYKNDVLKKRLSELYGENTKLDDSKCCVCIPVVDISDFRGVVIKTTHDKELTRPDGKLFMTDIALATSAAPTFFPISSLSGISKNFVVDGGIWFNNPALIGVMEALLYFVGDNKDYENIDLLSIGNLNVDAGWNIKNKRNASLINWNKKLIELPMSCNSKGIEYIMNFGKNHNLFNLNNYIRLINKNITNHQRNIFDLDNAEKKTLKAIEEIAYTDANEFKNIKNLKNIFSGIRKDWEFPVT